jgi:hypothetical protein
MLAVFVNCREKKGAEFHGRWVPFFVALVLLLRLKKHECDVKHVLLEKAHLSTLFKRTAVHTCHITYKLCNYVFWNSLCRWMFIGPPISTVAAPRDISTSSCLCAKPKIVQLRILE